MTFTGKPWTKESRIEVDLIALTSSGQKIAVYVPEARLRADCPTLAHCAGAVAQLLTAVLQERGISDDPSSDIEISGNERVTLRIGSPNVKIIGGKLDVCVRAPLAAPVIHTVPRTAAPNSIISIVGLNFGNDPDDLCVQLIPETPGALPPLQLRALAIDDLTDGNQRLFAQLISPANDGMPRRIAITRGRGVTRRFVMEFDDIVQSKPIWVWEGAGSKTAISPRSVRPSLALADEVCSSNSVTNDTRLDTAFGATWGRGGRVRIAFTVSSEECQIDSYAPEICFTQGGTIEACARRIRSLLERAFAQEGMCPNLRVQASRRGATATVSAQILGDAERPTNLESGSLSICFTEDEDCEPDEEERLDDDRDAVNDDWENEFYGAEGYDHHSDRLPLDCEVRFRRSRRDPDGDGRPGMFEFAFHTDPCVYDVPRPMKLELTSAGPILSYERHRLADRTFHFDLEVSGNAKRWSAHFPAEAVRLQRPGSTTTKVQLHLQPPAGNPGQFFYRIVARPKF